MQKIRRAVRCTSLRRAKSTTSAPIIGRSREHGARAMRKAISGSRGISMNVARSTLLPGLFGILLAAPLLFSQRSFSTTYDSSRQVKLHGVVTRIDWVNPNAFFFIDVKDAAGTVTNWAIQFGNPLELERSGWKRSSLHIGDAVSIEGTPARGATRQANAKSVV